MKVMKHLASTIVFLTTLTYIHASNECDHTLSNSDFKEGTYKITRSGTYCLTEDIVFDPRAGSIHDPNKEGAWFPVNDDIYPGSNTHADGGYALGFFSAISITVSDVELDLNGYKIKMSKAFYIQQRFFNLIEIQNAPFNSGQGPTSFGDTVPKIHNIRIHNGILGLSSHNGIHGFDVERVYIENIKIYNFEVAGLQLNGFKYVTIRNVDIGPSSTDVPFWGYYSHARFSLLGFNLIDHKEEKYVRFKGNRKLTLQQIHDNLRDSLNIAYRYEMGQSTDYDKQHPLYTIALQLYLNPYRLPDGSSLYGMIFNSRGFAVQGFGDAPNEDSEDGNKLYIENVNINGLVLSAHEIPALYFDRCEGHYYNDDGSTSITPVTGRFGDSFDIRKALKYDAWHYLDRGYFDFDIKYEGNPLADAQVALGIFSPSFQNNWGLKANDNTIGRQTWYQWATDNDNDKYDSLPTCARFMCNADAMVHLNKGIIGLRLDAIEHTVISDLHISNLYNKSPLGSLACGSYRGPFDGGQENQLEREGYMGTDIKGISIIDGGWAELYGSLVIDGCVSDNGDVIGIHVMDDAQLYVDEPERLEWKHLESGAAVTVDKYEAMLHDGVSPYPNNFYECNVKTEQLYKRAKDVYPYDVRKNKRHHTSTKGYIYPKGSIKAECNELYFNEGGERRRRLLQ